jgi:hypothetical protein
MRSFYTHHDHTAIESSLVASTKWIYLALAAVALLQPKRESQPHGSRGGETYRVFNEEEGQIGLF